MRPRSDEGVATIAAVTLVAVLAATGCVAAAVGQQAWARDRLSTAADIAALAAAQAVTDPCSAAQAMAAAHAVTLSGCQIDGRDIVVTVTSAAPPLVSRLVGLLGHRSGALVATARAGQPEVTDLSIPQTVR